VLPDLFIEQDTPAKMYANAGLDTRGIVAVVQKALGRKADRPAGQIA
jgi:1-deoxy-D-xylulose-5-phosphate synthase